MRLVKFQYTGNPITYPAEGVEAFGKTEILDGFIVGEYNGTDETLEAYTGEWPIGKTEQEAAAARKKRNELLTETDWVVPVTDHSQHAEYMTYRQALRDVTAQTGFPTTITWPTKP